MYLRLIPLFLLPFSLAWAQDQTPTSESSQTPPVVETSPEDMNNKQIWLAHVQKNLPENLCQPDMSFIKCFETTEKECKVMAQWFTSACLNNIEPSLPDQIDQPAGEKWGAITGRCVYDLYQKFLGAKYIESEECPRVAQAQEEPIGVQPIVDPTKPSHHD